MKRNEEHESESASLPGIGMFNVNAGVWELRIPIPDAPIFWFNLNLSSSRITILTSNLPSSTSRTRAPTLTHKNKTQARSSQEP